MNKYIYALIISCFFLVTTVHAELFIKITNTQKPSFREVYVHANIQDLIIKHCASYTEEQWQADPSVRMACASDPQNILFTHHFSKSDDKLPHGHARVVLAFEPGLPGHVKQCASQMISLIKPVEIVSLEYPKDFDCY